MVSEEINARLNSVVFGCGFRSLRAFALATGINPITFIGNVNQGKEPRYSTMAAILNAHPQISAEWLMRGEGDMFRTGEQHANVMHGDKLTCAMGVDNNSENTNATLVEQLRKEVASLQEQLREKDTQIASLLAILSK